METYQLLVFVHVLSALWLSASAFGGAVVRAAGKRADDLSTKTACLRIGWRLASVFGVPGSLVAGATGLTLVFVNRSWLEAGWVHAAIALWAALIASTLFYNVPRLRKTLAAAEASLAAGEPTEELKRLSASKMPARIADLTALGVVVFVVLMVLRPF
jgi:hypothetical protein